MNDTLQTMKSIALSIGIAILLPLTAHYALEVVVPNPGYGIEHETARDWHDKVQFYTLMLIALAEIVAGVYIAAGFIGAGFILGGVFTFIRAGFGFWQYLSNFMHLAFLLVGLLAVLAASYKIMRKKS